MNHDFDTVPNRIHTNSLKYDFARERAMPEGLLPLWVADMDFPAPPKVLEELHRVAAHGIFGYTEVKDAYFNALNDWFTARFGFSFAPKDVVKSPGVVFALAQAVRAFTRPGEGVLIQTPVYYPFYEVIRDNGRRIVTNPLRYEGGAYTMDFADFERKIQSEKVKLFLLCSPHNPVGRVWTKAELETLNEICERYGVLVVSDEIHCDFVHSGHRHACFGLINENAVIATAPSKTFNLAGLQVANIIVKNEALRRTFKAEIGKTGYSQLNTMGLAACQSAYLHGADWLEQLKVYLAQNIGLVKHFLAERLPQIRLVEPQGTYLLWLDFTAYGLSASELDRRIIQDAKLWLDGGTLFGHEGEGFQRVNIACPRSTLLEALNRLENAFASENGLG